MTISLRTVVCMKWGRLYSPDYVNVLYRACRKFLRGEFKFICFTDDADDLIPQIEVHPIPDIGLNEADYLSGAWPKIGVFLDHKNILLGRCLFIDLDTVILDQIDDLFEYSGRLVAINSAPWRRRGGPPRTGTGIFAFDSGALSILPATLVADKTRLIEKYKIEQDFIHNTISDISYWPDDWVISFKYHVRRPLLIDRFLGPRKPMPPSKILAFHGKPRPIDLIKPGSGNWDKFPHYGRGVVPWMCDYWYGFGGR